MTSPRGAPRLGPLVIRATFVEGEGRREGYLTNVSAGGAFLAIDDPPALGAEIELSAVLPWRLGELRGRARVVWRSVHPPTDRETLAGAGLAFSTLAPEARARLDAYLARFLELAAQLEETDER